MRLSTPCQMIYGGAPSHRGIVAVKFLRWELENSRISMDTRIIPYQFREEVGLLALMQLISSHAFHMALLSTSSILCSRVYILNTWLRSLSLSIISPVYNYLCNVPEFYKSTS